MTIASDATACVKLDSESTLDQGGIADGQADHRAHESAGLSTDESEPTRIVGVIPDVVDEVCRRADARAIATSLSSSASRPGLCQHVHNARSKTESSGQMRSLLSYWLSETWPSEFYRSSSLTLCCNYRCALWSHRPTLASSLTGTDGRSGGDPVPRFGCVSLERRWRSMETHRPGVIPHCLESPTRRPVARPVRSPGTLCQLPSASWQRAKSTSFSRHVEVKGLLAVSRCINSGKSGPASNITRRDGRLNGNPLRQALSPGAARLIGPAGLSCLTDSPTGLVQRHHCPATSWLTGPLLIEPSGLRATWRYATSDTQENKCQDERPPSASGVSAAISADASGT